MDKCTADWHIFGATLGLPDERGRHRSVEVTYTRGYKGKWVAVGHEQIGRVLGWDATLGYDNWPDDLCVSHDQMRRMRSPEQASRPHPPVKPNRRRSHR